jgi:hypothetical protein
MANVVLVMYIVVSVLEDKASTPTQSEPLEQKKQK